MSSQMLNLIARSAECHSGGNKSSAHLTFNIYGYVPSLAAGIVFLVVFSLLSIAHLGVLVRSRVWWTVVITVGGVCEILGWVGRVWSAENVYNINGFLLQEILLILAPCFFSAAVYGILGMFVRAVGPEHSRLRPSWYLWVFCTADLIAIVIQAVGGGSAAVALANCHSSVTGTHIMLAGIVFQLFSMIVFCLLGLDFVRRAKAAPGYESKANVEGGRVPLLTWSLGWASAWILVRCIYRTVELAQGWSGYSITHEPFFLCLDAIPMVFCMAGLISAHPYFCLPEFGLLSTSKERPVTGDGASEKVARV